MARPMTRGSDDQGANSLGAWVDERSPQWAEHALVDYPFRLTKRCFHAERVPGNTADCTSSSLAARCTTT